MILYVYESILMSSRHEQTRISMLSHAYDTPHHIQKIIIAGYRRMSPQQKLARVSELALGLCLS